MLLRAFYLWKCPFDIQLFKLCGLHENAGLASWRREFCVLNWWSVECVQHKQQQQKFLVMSHCYVSSSGCDSTAYWSPQNHPCIYPVLDCLWITANKWWLLWHNCPFPRCIKVHLNSFGVTTTYAFVLKVLSFENIRCLRAWARKVRERGLIS